MPIQRFACGSRTLETSAGTAISVSAVVRFACILLFSAGCLTTDAVRPAHHVGEMGFIYEFPIPMFNSIQSRWHMGNWITIGATLFK